MLFTFTTLEDLKNFIKEGKEGREFFFQKLDLDEPIKEILKENLYEENILDLIDECHEILNSNPVSFYSQATLSKYLM